MLRRLKEFDDSALLKDESYRAFVEGFESDILRALGKLSVLKVIKSYGAEGIYGYQLLKDLREMTNNMFIIEEGTLYPMLRNLERWRTGEKQIQLVKSEKRGEGRPKKYYYLTEDGKKILNHLEGLYAKIVGSVAGLFDFRVELAEGTYCPNCSYKFDKHYQGSFCEMCGLNVEKIVGRSD